jgi:iron(III) transport system permease protein
MFALISLLPIAGIALKAVFGSGFVNITQWAGKSIFNSLWGAVLAATIIVCIGTVLGHAIARNIAGTRLFDLLGVFVFVIPAVVLGIGCISLWNHPETQIIYGSIGIMVAGYVARYGIIGIRTIAITTAQTPVSLEQAASAFGAGYFRRYFRIVLPLQWRALSGAWLLAVVFCLRDLDTVVLFYPPGWEPLTVRIFTLEANGPQPVIAGLAILQIIMTASVIVISLLVLGMRKQT